METPDIEWEKEFEEKFGDTFRLCCDDKTLSPVIKTFIQNLLSSRDTYWAERVEAERERIYDAIDDYFISPNPIPDAKILCGYIRETLKENLEVCETCGERHITNKDNLK